MALSSRLRTTRAISGVERVTIGDGRFMTPRSSTPLARAGTEALARASEIAAERRAALLCFEADHLGCHRKILADLISRDIGCEIVNL